MAYLDARQDTSNPAGFDAMLTTVHAPISGGAGFEWPIIGQALVELRSAGGRISANGVRAFCRKLLQPARAGVITDADWDAAKRQLRAEDAARQTQEPTP